MTNQQMDARRKVLSRLNAWCGPIGKVAHERVDWSMRQYVDDIAQCRRAGMSVGNAIHLLNERGVPPAVQRRVLSSAPSRSARCAPYGQG